MALILRLEIVWKSIHPLEEFKNPKKLRKRRAEKAEHADPPDKNAKVLQNGTVTVPVLSVPTHGFLQYDCCTKKSVKIVTDQRLDVRDSTFNMEK
ncbi:unnamed protein product [Strongylus vulgaris]|uniref:Uncharacterized protein n=1 Tax=Strongylus vulgaris TaxID=40348 RepID=A0A3P7I9Y4_STRVU|nr:unnamed protein product [Strongylus vulgaris]